MNAKEARQISDKFILDCNANQYDDVMAVIKHAASGCATSCRFYTKLCPEVITRRRITIMR